MKFLLSIFFTWWVLFACAADDTLKTIIVPSKIPLSQLISQKRAILLDNLLEKNIPEIRSNIKKLQDLEDQNYFTIFQDENMMVFYETGDFPEILDLALRNQEINHQRKNKIPPQQDNLGNKLLQMLTMDKDMIIDRINKSGQSQYEKDFLILNLNFLLSKTDQTALINEQADIFLKSYPGNPYVSFVRIYIRHIYIRRPWSMGVEFFSGYGMLSGSLESHYTNNVPIGVDFDICYKNLTLYLRDYIGFSHTRHEFTNKGVLWEENSQVRVFLPEASIGYNVLKSKRFKLSPFAGIASTDIGPTSYDRDEEEGLDKYDLTFTTTWVTGINLDFLLGRQDALSGSTFFLRLRYAYTFPQFGKYYSGFDGDMQYITLGVGSFAWKAKRDY